MTVLSYVSFYVDRYRIYNQFSLEMAFSSLNVQ